MLGWIIMIKITTSALKKFDFNKHISVFHDKEGKTPKKIKISYELSINNIEVKEEKEVCFTVGTIIEVENILEMKSIIEVVGKMDNPDEVIRKWKKKEYFPDEDRIVNHCFTKFVPMFSLISHFAKTPSLIPSPFKENEAGRKTKEKK